MHSLSQAGGGSTLHSASAGLIYTYPCLFLLQNLVRASLVFFIHNSQYQCIELNTGFRILQTLSATI